MTLLGKKVKRIASKGLCSFGNRKYPLVEVQFESGEKFMALFNSIINEVKIN